MSFEPQDLPDIIKKGLQVDLISLDDNGQVDVGNMNLDGLIGLLNNVRQNPSEVIGQLLKVMQGLNSLVYQYSEKYDEQNEAMKLLDAELRGKFSRKDQSNPLFVNGVKLTNDNIDAEVRKDDEYQDMRNKVKKYKNYKSFLLTSYSIVNKTYDAALQVAKMKVSKSDSELKEDIKEIAQGFSDD